LYWPDPWAQLGQCIADADGVLVLGLRQLSVGAGIWRPGTAEERVAASYLTSAWMQLEAGMALMAGLPTLVVAEAGVEEGVFDPRTWTGLVSGAALDTSAIDETVAAWAAVVMASTT
jgi:hypothetical protein